VTQEYLASYFSDFRTPYGLTQDRASNPQLCSTAAAGFGNLIIAITSSKEEAVQKIHQTLDTLLDNNPPENHGWLYHFTYADGKPYPNTEVSTVDTAIFYTGTKLASKIINDPDLTKFVDEEIAKIDVQWMTVRGLIRHGTLSGHFIPYFWDNYNEGIIIYKLFDLPYNPPQFEYHLPIFAYYYPLAFYPNDTFIKTQLERAIDYHMTNYKQLVTSTDTKTGYQSFAFGYTSPIVQYALGLGNDVTHSYCQDWKSDDRIGIDEGAAFLMRRNYLV
jgi:hypothetical protein